MCRRLRPELLDAAGEGDDEASESGPFGHIPDPPLRAAAVAASTTVAMNLIPLGYPAQTVRQRPRARRSPWRFRETSRTVRHYPTSGDERPARTARDRIAWALTAGTLLQFLSALRGRSRSSRGSRSFYSTWSATEKVGGCGGIRSVRNSLRFSYTKDQSNFRRPSRSLLPSGHPHQGPDEAKRSYMSSPKALKPLPYRKGTRFKSLGEYGETDDRWRRGRA